MTVSHPSGESDRFFTMSKPAAKKNHWTSRVNECSVCKDARGDLNVPLRGGAENGEFAYIGLVNEDVVVYKSGKLNEGELLLEVENLSISGLPLYDIQTLIKNCKGPVRLKTVRQGKRSHAELPSNLGMFRVHHLSGPVKGHLKCVKVFITMFHSTFAFGIKTTRFNSGVCQN